MNIAYDMFNEIYAVHPTAFPGMMALATTADVHAYSNDLWAMADPIATAFLAVEDPPVADAMLVMRVNELVKNRQTEVMRAIMPPPSRPTIADKPAGSQPGQPAGGQVNREGEAESNPRRPQNSSQPQVSNSNTRQSAPSADVTARPVSTLPDDGYELFDCRMAPTKCPTFLRQFPVARHRSMMQRLKDHERDIPELPEAAGISPDDAFMRWVGVQVGASSVVDYDEAGRQILEKQTTGRINLSTNGQTTLDLLNDWSDVPIGHYRTEHQALAIARVALTFSPQTLTDLVMVDASMYRRLVRRARCDLFYKIRNRLSLLLVAHRQYRMHAGGNTTLVPDTTPKPSRPQVERIDLIGDRDMRQLGPRFVRETSQQHRRGAEVPPPPGLDASEPPSGTNERNAELQYRPPPPQQLTVISTDRLSLSPSNWMSMLDRAALFNTSERGRYAYNTSAPQRWPQFAYYFGYQQQPKPIQGSDGMPQAAPIPYMSQYSSISLAERVPSNVRLPLFKHEERLTPDQDFDHWYQTCFVEKLHNLVTITSHPDAMFSLLVAAINLPLRQMVEGLIDVGSHDMELQKYDLLKDIGSKVGGMQWLRFVLQARCSKNTATMVQQAHLILFNARSESDGSTLDFVLDKIKWATTMLEHRPGFTYQTSVRAVIRAFEYISRDALSTRIKQRSANVAQLDERPVIRQFQYMDEQTDQGDRLPNGYIDWHSRYKSILSSAYDLARGLMAERKQVQPEEHNFPTYLRRPPTVVDPMGYMSTVYIERKPRSVAYDPSERRRSRSRPTSPHVRYSDRERSRSRGRSVERHDYTRRSYSSERRDRSPFRQADRRTDDAYVKPQPDSGTVQASVQQALAEFSAALGSRYAHLDSRAPDRDRSRSRGRDDRPRPPTRDGSRDSRDRRDGNRRRDHSEGRRTDSHPDRRPGNRNNSKSPARPPPPAPIPTPPVVASVEQATNERASA